MADRGLLQPHPPGWGEETPSQATCRTSQPAGEWRNGPTGQGSQPRRAPGGTASGFDFETAVSVSYSGLRLCEPRRHRRAAEPLRTRGHVRPAASVLDDLEDVALLLL